MRRLALVLAGLLLAGLVLAGLGYRSAVADPVVRRASVSLPNWPAGARPVTIALLSDMHIGNAATDEARLARVVEQVNALRPDLVALAGDYVAGHGPEDADSAVELAPLRRLRAPLGVVAVLGNHDHWTSAPRVRAALEAAGVTVLVNRAVQLGPITVQGAGDVVTSHADLGWVRRAEAGKPQVLLTHSPDLARKTRTTLVLAGHTHCGQILLPLYGPPVSVSRYGSRYLCGVVRRGGQTVIVTAGIGTSVLPLRWRAPPDLWLVRVGP